MLIHHLFQRLQSGGVQRRDWNRTPRGDRRWRSGMIDIVRLNEFSKWAEQLRVWYIRSISDHEFWILGRTGWGVGWLVWSRATMRASAERLRADLTFWSQGLEEEWDLGAFKKMTWMHGWSWRLPRQSVGWNSVICQNQFSQHQKAAAKWGKILIRWTCSREMPLDGRHQ